MKYRYSFNQIILSLLALGALSAVALYCALSYENKYNADVLNFLPANNTQNVTSILEKQLSEEHIRLLDSIQHAFSISATEWHDTLEKIKKIKQSDTLVIANPKMFSNPTEDPLIIKTRKILLSFAIDPKRVTIFTINEPNNACDAATGQCYNKGIVEHYIRLNTAQLKNRPEDVQEALLTHEIMHLLNYDSLEQIYIETLLKNKGIDSKVYHAHPAFVAYCKHLEFRADLLAGSQDITTAQNLKKVFQLQIERDPNEKSTLTHPSYTQRSAAMDKLMSHLKTEQNGEQV